MATQTSASLLRFVPSSPPLSSVRSTASSAFVEIPMNGVSSRTKRAYSVSQLVRPNHMAVTVRASMGKGEPPNSGSGDSDGEVEAAADLFRRKLRGSASVDELARLLDQIHSKKHYSTLISLYEEMRTFGVSPNRDVFVIVISAYCKLHDTNSALELLRDTKISKSCKTALAYSMVMTASFKSGKPDVAFELLRKMEDGGSCKPDVVTYNTMILGLCEMGRTDDALGLLREMLEGGICKPDGLTYNAMISGLCKMGRTDDALELLRAMEEGESCKPNNATYVTLIVGLCDMGRTDDALDLLRAMEEGDSCQPDVWTYNMMIIGLCKVGRTDDALELLRVMEEGESCEPNNATYMTLIMELHRRGNTDAALQMVSKVDERGRATLKAMRLL